MQPLVASGKLRPLAVTSRQRARIVPDVPTLAELGLKDFDITVWAAIVAPRGISAPAHERLVQAAARVVRTPALVKLIRDGGDDPLEIPAADLPRFFANEGARWGELVKESGATID